MTIKIILYEYMEIFLMSYTHLSPSDIFLFLFYLYSPQLPYQFRIPFSLFLPLSYILFFLFFCIFSYICRLSQLELLNILTASLQRCKTPLTSDTRQSDGEAPVLKLFPSPLWPGVTAPDRVLSLGLRERHGI